MILTLDMTAMISTNHTGGVTIWGENCNTNAVRLGAQESHDREGKPVQRD